MLQLFFGIIALTVAVFATIFSGHKIYIGAIVAALIYVIRGIVELARDK